MTSDIQLLVSVPKAIILLLSLCVILAAIWWDLEKNKR